MLLHTLPGRISMKRNEGFVHRAVGIINRISDYGGIVSGSCILVSGFVIFYGAFVRYVLNHPTIWEIELSAYLLIASTFFAAASALRHGVHVSVDLLIVRLPVKIRLWVEIVTSVFSFIFCLVLAKKGWVMFYDALTKGWHSESLWAPPLYIPYVIMPVGMLLLGLQFLVLIIKRFATVLDKGGASCE